MQKHRLAIMLLENAHGFARLAQPGREDKARLERHMDDSFALLAPKDQQRVAAALATTPVLPRTVVRQILDADPAAAIPFVTRSPAIDATMLAGLIGRHGAGPLVRAIARRAHLPAALKAQLRGLHDPGVDRALELRQPSTEPGTISLQPLHAQTTHQRPVETQASQLIAELARTGQTEEIQAMIRSRTGLGIQSVRQLCADPTSRNFLHALRFLGLSTSDASDVFRAFSDQAIGGSESVLARFRAVYEEILPTQAAQRVSLWRLDELRQLARKADNDRDGELQAVKNRSAG